MNIISIIHNKIRTNKSEILKIIKLFLIAFTLNVFLLFFINVFTNGMVNDAFFNADSLRAFDDLTNHLGNHYRTRVHPLFVIFTQPFVWMLKIIFSSPNATIIFQSFIGALCVILFYFNLKKINKKNINLNPILAIFILSFSQIVFSSIFETYIFAEFTLLIMWLIGQNLVDKKLNYLNILTLIIVGVLAISITITNYFQFIILLIFVILFNKKVNNKIATFLSIIFLSSSVAVLLACLQNIIWPSANNFFTASIEGFLLNKNSEEFLYIDKNLSLTNILMQIKASTVFQFSLFGNYRLTDFTFYSNIFIDLFACLLFAMFAWLNINFILHEKSNILKHKFYLSILCAYGFNFVLHLFYGPRESFLYTLNYIYLPYFMIFYIVNNSNFSLLNFINKKKKFFTVCLIVFLLLQIIGIIRYLYSAFMLFGFNNTMPKRLFITIFISVSILLFLYIKNKIYALFIVILLAVISITGIKSINKTLTSRPIKNEEMLISAKSDYKYFMNSNENINLISSLASYYYELNIPLNRENYYVGKFEKTDKKYSNFYYFGMVDRRKILYKEGKLIDLKTKEVIKEFPYKHELIIPNEYTVLLSDENKNIIKIFENEDGVFIKQNDKIELITSGKQKFNLPTFKDKKYANTLRVLNQEILFNFDGIILKPNIISYKNSNNVWYRDTMIATMVLAYTNNTHLLEPWVKTISNIYDCQRSLVNNDHNCSIKEADNPGELLYILGVVKNNRSDLKEKIINEVKTKSHDGLFSGLVDGEEMSFYPTSLLLFGAKKNNIDLSKYLKTPTVLDHYASLTWWDKETPRYNITPIDSVLFSYLEWGSTHYKNGHYGKVHILDEYYPLSYEAGLSQEIADDQKFVSEHYSVPGGPILTHIWHAAEIFLLLAEM